MLDWSNRSLLRLLSIVCKLLRSLRQLCRQPQLPSRRKLQREALPAFAAVLVLQQQLARGGVPRHQLPAVAGPHSAALGYQRTAL
jgi:hypothetical protein